MRTKVDHARIAELAADGKTKTEISKIMGLLYTTVTTSCATHNIKTAKREPAGRPSGGKNATKPKPAKPNPFADLPRATVAAITKPTAASNKAAHIENVADEMQIIREIADDAGIPARPCESRKPSVVEALALKIKLPWAGKVQQQTPADLAPDLYDALIGYANFSAEDLAQVFGFSNEGFRVWLKKYGYPVRESAAAEPVEHDLTIKPRAGQTFAGREKEMAAKRAESYEKLKTAVAGNEIKLSTASPVIFRAHDFAADTFTPEDDAPIPYTMDLRDCAARLLAAIDAREAAVAEVKKYQDLIRRLA